METTGTLAADRTRLAFAKVAKRGAAITFASPLDNLHDLRKRCKELRYALEFFAPLYPADSYGAVLADLKRLQDCLGEFQDAEVQRMELHAFADRMLDERSAPTATLFAMGEIAAGLASRQRKARADFDGRFAAFASTASQARLAALTQAGGT